EQGQVLGRVDIQGEVEVGEHRGLAISVRAEGEVPGEAGWAKARTYRVGWAQQQRVGALAVAAGANNDGARRGGRGRDAAQVVRGDEWDIGRQDQNAGRAALARFLDARAGGGVHLTRVGDHGDAADVARDFGIEYGDHTVEVWRGGAAGEHIAQHGGHQ